MMSRKHFIILSDLIRKHDIAYKEEAFVSELMDYLKKENPFFDKERFKYACLRHE